MLGAVSGEVLEGSVEEDRSSARKPRLKHITSSENPVKGGRTALYSLVF